VLGFVGVAGVQFTYYYTISKIQVGPAVLIQYLSPVWIALYAFVFQKEPPTKTKINSPPFGSPGCYFTSVGIDWICFRLNRIGILSGLISSLFFSFYALYGEKGLKKYDPWTLILYGFGFGAVLYWLLISPMRMIHRRVFFRIWVAFLYIAIFSP